MSWWQKKLLRYGLRYVLQRTGLLEDDAIDLDKLDITIGKQNVIELKDVGLNITRITKLAQLPPSLRLEVARVLSLRLTIPADFYQSSIVVEVDGIEIMARLEEEAVAHTPPRRTQRSRSPATTRTPQHRKMNRRLHLPPQYDPGGVQDSQEDVRVPTMQEVAKSFLMEESMQERRQLEAQVAAESQNVEESFVSESSEGDAAGVGMGVGVPGFLSNFLQGIIDRSKLDIRNVEVRVETNVRTETELATPLTLRFAVGSAEVDRMSALKGDVEEAVDPKRSMELREISVALLSNKTVLSETSGFSSQASKQGSVLPSREGSSAASSVHAIEIPAGRRTSSASVKGSQNSTSALSVDRAFRPTALSSSSPEHLPPVHEGIQQTRGAEKFLDANAVLSEDVQGIASEFDIRAGDDNVSWGSRRSQSNAPVEDLWKSMVSDDDLPDSFIVEEHRIPTPKVGSPRANSPLAGRQRRRDSPYDRSVHSPGSWPRLEESLQRHRLHQGPGSWPVLDQSLHSTCDPLDQVLTASVRNQGVTDNKRDALELAETTHEDVESASEPQEPAADEMLESRLYSHEEAQSMYMSAMTGSSEMAMPGGWEPDAQSQRSSSPDVDQKLSRADLPSLDEKIRQDEFMPSGNVTPRVGIPDVLRTGASRPQQRPASEIILELVHVDTLTVAVPISGHNDHPVSEQHQHPVTQSSPRDRNAPQGTPGTFSAYSDLSGSKRRGVGSVYGEVNSVLFAPPERITPAKERSSLAIAVGMVTVQMDIVTCRLIHDLSYIASSPVAASDTKDPTASGKLGNAEDTTLPFTLQLTRFSLSLREAIPPGITGNRLDVTPGVLDIHCHRVEIGSADDTSLRLGAFAVELGGAELLSLEHDNNNHLTPNSPASDATVLSLTVQRNRIGVNKRAVTDVSLQTTRVHLTLDLEQVDETFGSLGGLSGVLELGNSFISENGTNSPVTPKAQKGVRFAGDAESSNLNAELKLNARVGGATILLRAPSSYVELRTSTLKAIYREHGAVATLEQIAITGPRLRNDAHNAPLALDLSSLRIEYLLAPQDKDLERLLSLLTPSKDKYDTEDDILIDTLLRQRRKGSLLRFAVGEIKLKVEDWQRLQSLTALSDDLAKLSAVAKYLPEDDRPGLLTLLRVKDAEAQLPINVRFGKLRLQLQDLHLAHVGIPALLAFSVGSIKSDGLHGARLLHSLVPQASADNLPVIMARMLGDEAEPTVKIKLLNLCMEYSVPVVLDLTGIDKETDTEDMVAAVVQSVANLVMADVPATLQRSPGSDVSKMATKRANIDLLIHDSAIGLTPQNLSSKALIVLSDTHISTTIPPEETIGVKLDIRKASVFITDRHVEEQAGPIGPDRMSANYTNTSHRLDTSLQRQGFVSVGSLMSAEISFTATEETVSDSKCVEVDIKNELFLLETCADSTQTLIATLSALAPPTPPNKVPKYLTEPMPIEDLVNSFSGEALPQPELTRAPEVLYDVEEDAAEEDGLDMPYSNSNLYNEPDDLLTQSAMTGSLYGPISGIIGADDIAERESAIGDDYPETAESLLEDDPFEMTNEADVRMGDAALLRDLGRQCKPAVSNGVIEAGLHEIEDLGYDVLGCGQQALGSHNRFDAPLVGNRGRRMRTQVKNIPFRLRLRDFHVIWHLYDGYDWQRTRERIVEGVEQVELKAEERKTRRRTSHNDQEGDESVIGDFLFNSIYIGVPADLDAQDLRRQINRGIDEDVSETASIPVSAMSRPTTYSASVGPSRQRQRRRLKLGRSKNHKISFELKGVAADVLIFPPGSGEIVSSVDLRLKDFEIFDKVPTSTWRKFLTHMTSDPRARETAKPMFHIQLDTVKTLESHSASEFMLHVTVLPIRLHVDQDALDFITRFFEFKDECTATAGPEGERPFIQRVEVDTVDMCLDYKPKNVDYAGIRSGKTSEFMNFITLEAANIRLKHAILYGLNGFEELHPRLNGLWMPDVTRNQLPGVLAGLAPIRSLANLGMGVRDVIAIPVREYQKDGRIVRSIQKGAFQFGKTTASELARLGAKVALGTQTILSNTEDLLSPLAERSSRPSTGGRASGEQGWHDVASDNEEPEQRAVSAYANQPLGLLQGLRSARRHLEHDLLTAKDALIAVQGEVLDSRGPGNAAAAVVKYAPTVILRPVIGATRAVGTTLLGVGNQIDRNNLRRIDDKYKRR